MNFCIVRLFASSREDLKGEKLRELGGFREHGKESEGQQALNVWDFTLFE